MNLEEKSKQYGISQSKWCMGNQEIALCSNGFNDGYTQCKTDLIDFLKVNHRASVKDILKHLEDLV